MRLICKYYKYLFYRLYLSLEKYGSPPFWSEWKAASLLVLMSYSIVYSLILYYTIFVNRYSNLGSNLYLIFSILIIFSILNYLIFLYKNKWTEIVENFNSFSKNKNRIGTIFFILFCVGCIANIVFAFYLVSQTNWNLS